jgi:hypothetical protein
VLAAQLGDMLPALKLLCDDARKAFAQALTAHIIEAALAGPEEPEAGTATAPRRTTRRPPAAATRPPPSERDVSHGHTVSQSEAAALIGGMIIQGIGGLGRRDRGPPAGGTPSRGGGSRCHHNPQTSQTHCGPG